jgi:ergothioneine biosynthesis protein EgtB
MTASSRPSSEFNATRYALTCRFERVRRFTEELCRPLQPEDYVLQSMPDASPAKWHLAHTSWFFETFVLGPEGEAPFDPAYNFLFNSYYNAVGERHARPQRGMLSRPTVSEVYRYRAHVDARLLARLASMPAARFAAIAPVLELGLHHEQQHQELLLTDILHAFAQSPLRPSYRGDATAPPAARSAASKQGWVAYEGGLHEIGWTGESFAFDNEGPRHRVYQEPFELACRLVTAGEYLEFIRDGGYERAELWLSDGWSTANERGWKAPLYWELRDGSYFQMTLDGLLPLDLDAPVCHVSFYEADALARYNGARLCTEAEWEIATNGLLVEGNFVESAALRPLAARGSPDPGPVRTQAPRQMFGDVWEWTASSYSPYPGYAPPPGALGEYNGKFMCNQLVLRGGSCVTAQDHMRATYRNFFPASSRWQFSGVRLARSMRGAR